MNRVKIRKAKEDVVFTNEREVQLFFSGWLSALDNLKRIITTKEKYSNTATTNPYKELLGLINIKKEQGNIMYTSELKKIKELDNGK